MSNIFIFRRDYRIFDNTGLKETLSKYDNVIPIFIGTPEQLVNNDYKSDYSVQFLCETLCELADEFKKNKSKLHCFFGENVKVLKDIHKKNKINSVNFNMDYTPYAIKRDNEIKEFCEKNSIECNMYHDYLLVPPGQVLTLSGTPYKVYGQFQKKEINIEIPKPKIIKKSELKNLNKLKDKTLDSTFLKKYYNEKENVRRIGGRDAGLMILFKMADFNNYAECRNELIYETTELSAYIKFGCVSIREVYWKIMKSVTNKDSQQNLINQLIWRDFYFNILYHFPENLGNNFRSKFDTFQWVNNKKWFKAWCDGKTGFPIVDAGMRELNETGYMHNRSRLITSNFLTRILICDWQWGEKYYAQNLRDYDPAVNNGNWQWSAGTGTDTAPFSQRIFNPWLQSNKFDPTCEYIKKWVPELANVPNCDIHKWDTKYKNHNLKELDYPEPIVDYKKQRAEVKIIYKKI